MQIADAVLSVLSKGTSKAVKESSLLEEVSKKTGAIWADIRDCLEDLHSRRIIEYYEDTSIGENMWFIP